MKKVVLSLAVIATVACLASCNKTCNCKTYAAGSVVAEKEVELSDTDFDKCSDMTEVKTVEGLKSGIECE